MVGRATKLVLIGGAGNIGGSLAFLAASKGLVNEIVIFDLKDSVCSGKALDIAQCSGLFCTDLKLSGSSDYKDLEGADVIVVTAGLARQPGMSRDDLLAKNSSIISDIAVKIKENAKGEPLIIVVTNPLDVMTWVMLKNTGFSKKKVIGMSGALDTSRLNHFIANELQVSTQCVSSIIFGGHGDTMVLSRDYISISGIPLKKLIEMKRISDDAVSSICQRACDGGAEIVKLLGSGSAYYAPATCVAGMIESYLMDRRTLLSCCVALDGEYGVTGACVGVPIVLGRNGVEEIIELPLSQIDRSSFDKSVSSVKDLIKKL